MLNIGVLISGGGTNLQAVIDGTESGEIKGQVKVVISSKQGAYGLERAKNHNIKAICETDEDKIIEILKENKIDLVVLAGYLKIISPKLVNEFRNKMINIHPSLIPSFCGAGFYGEKVHQGVIDYGAKGVLEVEHRILKESISLFCENKLKLQGRRVFINE